MHMQSSEGPGKIWIDLDNSPHIPFFIPIIEELEKQGYPTFLTARDAYQVVELLDLHRLVSRRIGRHYGKSKFMKVMGTCIRALQLIRAARKENLALAVSHGSRAQLIAAAIMRVPSLVIFDYEFAQGLEAARPTWTMMPEVIFSEVNPARTKRAMQYPGLKEDAYIARFRPDPAIRSSLGIGENDLMVTVRPPASEAHYHHAESDGLFHAMVDYLGQKAGVCMVVLPRNERQAVSIENAWPDLIQSGRLIIPDHVVNGLNLLWYSDLVISGGGTMNREAAALGVPVYSIFRGTIGAVDRYLAKAGRLVLLERAEDFDSKIRLCRWERPETPGKCQSGTLSAIVGNIVSILNPKPSSVARHVQEPASQVALRREHP
jgi:predicted glycosyltransferase